MEFHTIVGALSNRCLGDMALLLSVPVKDFCRVLFYWAFRFLENPFRHKDPEVAFVPSLLM